MGQSVKSFAASYDSSQRDKIRFAWNGKHATEFKDDNLEFRKAVVAAALSEPEKCPVSLISDLLEEEALCSREAWGAPTYFSELLTVLLRRGGREYLKEFAVAMNATFDTFGASHAIGISSQEAEQFLSDVDHLLIAEPDKKTRALLEAAKGLFEKIKNGNAAKGWAVLPPGTPVKNIKVVRHDKKAAIRNTAIYAVFLIVSLIGALTCESWLTRIATLLLVVWALGGVKYNWRAIRNGFVDLAVC